MNSKHIKVLACAAAVCGGVLASNANATPSGKDAGASPQEKPTAESESAPEGWHYDAGSGLGFGEQSIVTASAGLAFDSKFMSYGLVDNKDPIVTPSASITFFDWVNFEVAALFDVTKYGRKAGYSNRGGKYIELDPGASLSHAFTSEDLEWLPTTVEFSLGYAYEYHPEAMGHRTGDPGEDTQFVSFEVSLPDLWVEPTFQYERDISRDNGTYLNLELGHAFALIDGAREDDDPILSFRPSIGQGLGNTQRVAGYLVKHGTEDEALDHGGLMDTCIKGELTWQISSWLTLSGYVAYYDYLFDRQMRDAARDYEATGRDDTSYHFVGGLALNATF